MSSYNKVVLLGNVTRDVELRYTQSGTAVADVGLAVNSRRKQGDNWVEEVDFIDLTIWGRTAEVAAEYATKGTPILVDGRLKLDTWETTEGQKRSKLKVVVETLQLLGSKKGGTTAAKADEPAPVDVTTPGAEGATEGGDAVPF
jgi:single-strand DNA-binding protein